MAYDGDMKGQNLRKLKFGAKDDTVIWRSRSRIRFCVGLASVPRWFPSVGAFLSSHRFSLNVHCSSVSILTCWGRGQLLG